MMPNLQEKIDKKVKDYIQYHFDDEQFRILAIFFDLAQEDDSLETVYEVCILLLKQVLDLDCCLYILNSDNNLEIKKYSSGCTYNTLKSEYASITIDSPLFENDDFIVPIKYKQMVVDQLPLVPRGNMIGILQVKDAKLLSDKEKLFLEKFTNRLGFQIHNKMIANKNKEHLTFIKSLVYDIGHNVIVPNMYLKLLLKKMNKRLEKLKSGIDKFTSQFDSDPHECGKKEKYKKAIDTVNDLYSKVIDQHKNLFDNFAQSSLFLETLLRRSHFEQGQYVLIKRRCNFKIQIIESQLQRYRYRFEEKGIEIDVSMGGVPDKDVFLKVDIGLISQVFANLFSNAVKYTREVIDTQGRPKKFIAYGWEWVDNYYEQKAPAIKLNVFSTGPHVREEDRSQLFEPNFRADNAQDEAGTGRGLSFVKQIVELHDGEVGYTPVDLGNNFYIILPCESEHSRDSN